MLGANHYGYVAFGSPEWLAFKSSGSGRDDWLRYMLTNAYPRLVT